ncbi:hypothetical protein L218DRAFT_131690 [Marasmius fiardii PR-910]|nr:hypothetical protein L218DRAFT_131690 [Marasmius fiardii PR-910]
MFVLGSFINQVLVYRPTSVLIAPLGFKTRFLVKTNHDLLNEELDSSYCRFTRSSFTGSPLYPSSTAETPQVRETASWSAEGLRQNEGTSGTHCRVIFCRPAKQGLVLPHYPSILFFCRTARLCNQSFRSLLDAFLCRGRTSFKRS